MTRPAVAERGDDRAPGVIGVLVLLAVAIVAQWGHALRVPFINDDYVFLDEVRGHSLSSLASTSHLMFGWWRPISRELYYGVLERAFGARELPFHLVNLALALAVLAVYFVLVRRLAGARVATLACAGVAALAAWAVPMLWVAGAQELWMLLFALVCIHAFAFGSVAVAALALAAALLSKETAAVVPLIALATALIGRRMPVRTAIGRAVPLFVVGMIWVHVHPMVYAQIVGRIHGEIPAVAPAVSALHPSFAAVVGRTLLVPFNLDHPLAPEHGWLLALARAALSFVPLAALAWWAASLAPPAHGRGSQAAPSSPAPSPSSFTRHASLAGTWAVCGWLPVMWPQLGWHSYYTLLGALGVWLLIASVLVHRRAVAVVVIGALVVLRAGQAATPSLDWGTEWYQNRAAAFVRFMRADLKAHVPRPAPHSRLFFTGVPSNVGFLTAGAPALRVWYGDTTLAGGYLSQYAPRAVGSAAGDDRFFRYDSTAGWIETTDDSGRSAATRARDPQWRHDHEELAAAFARAHEWSRAGHEFALLAAAAPDPLEAATNAGVCFAMARDSTAAARWFDLAARQPRADDEVRRFAREFAHHLSSAP